MSLRPAFSTTACPEWTLEQVAAAAARYEFAGVELRSFGHGATNIACDPGLTNGQKVDRIFGRAGVGICGVASGARLDPQVFPPVVGNLRIFNPHKALNDAKHYVDLAHDIGADGMRVYGFRLSPREFRSVGRQRVVDRLSKVCDHARNRDVFVFIENGGSFPYASDLADLIERVDSPLLKASYDTATGAAVDECPEEAARILGTKLAVARISDHADGTPARLGAGEVPNEAFVRALPSNCDAWLVYEWNRIWTPELAGPDEVLPDVARTLYDWASNTGSASDAA